MRIAVFALLAASFAGTGHAQSQEEAAARASGPLQQKLAPGLARYTDEVLFGKVWPDTGLSPRDRSLVVISALIATNKPAQLQGHLGRALTNGVTPREASAALTHLAFYAGWPSVVSSLEVYDQVYTARAIDFSTLQTAVPTLPPDAATTAAARSVISPVGAVAPKFAELTEKVLFDDLWRRADLSVRDRSLVTIAALAAMGEGDLLGPYIRRGLEAGLTLDQIAEALTHLAFYGGWSRAIKALSALDRAAVVSEGAANGGIARRGTPPITAGPASHFTGSVRVLAPYRVTGTSRLGGSTVLFEPGARSAWHRHPQGQALVVTEGCGWTQIEGDPIEKICAGDVAWIAPGKKHWHGATRTIAMTHVTASESVEGQAVEWLEKVSEEEYARGPR